VRSSFAPVPLLRCNQRSCSTRVGHFTAYHNQRHTVSDEAVEKLGILFSEQLLLAALDLIDRDCGTRKHRLLLSVEITSLTSRVFFFSNSNQVHFALGPKPIFRPRDDRLLCRFSEPASILLHPVLLHLPCFLLCGTNIPFSDHGMCAYNLENVSSFVRQAVYLQCKHVLATLIAERLSKCIVREMNKDEFTTILA
jgi:hypothetical protein